MTVAAIVLAAGASRRLGQPKQLLTVDGVPLVRRIAERARAACDAACVVLGANAGEIVPALDGLGIPILVAMDWGEGMAASLRRGVEWAALSGHDAVAIFTCDQPRLSVAHARQLVERHRATGESVASRYAGTLGVPAVLGRARFPELVRLRGDRGARAVLREDPCVVVVDWPDGALDIDTPADAAALAQNS